MTLDLLFAALVGFGTLALAFATFRMASRAEDSVRVASEEVQIQRQTMQLLVRPVIGDVKRVPRSSLAPIDYVDHMLPWFSKPQTVPRDLLTAHWSPDEPERSRITISVPLRNIGRGPAWIRGSYLPDVPAPLDKSQWHSDIRLVPPVDQFRISWNVPLTLLLGKGGISEDIREAINDDPKSVEFDAVIMYEDEESNGLYSTRIAVRPSPDGPYVSEIQNYRRDEEFKWQRN